MCILREPSLLMSEYLRDFELHEIPTILSQMAHPMQSMDMNSRQNSRSVKIFLMFVMCADLDTIVRSWMINNFSVAHVDLIKQPFIKCPK